MDSAFEPSTLLSVLQASGMDNPPATLRELVELSEPDPHQPISQGTITTLEENIPGLGVNFSDSEALSSLVQEAATFP